MFVLIMYAVFFAQSIRRAQALTMSASHLIDVDMLLKTEGDEEEGPVQDGTVQENSPENNKLVTENDPQTDGMVPENYTQSSRLNTEGDLQTDGMVPESYTKSRRLITENDPQTDGMVPDKSAESNKMVTKNDANTDGMVTKKYTEIHELTRHMSRKKLRLIYDEHCTDVDSDACTSLLSKIVMRQSGNVKKNYLRVWMKKFDFRVCINEGAIVRYDPKNQICCNGVFNKTTGNEECCDGDIIDNSEQFCCNEQVRNRTESSMCCGIYTYDNRTHTCCNGKLYTKLEGSSCCGDFVYDESKQICCFDTFMFSRSRGDSCCGKDVYNSLTHTCCQTNIQPIHEKNNREGECCGDKNINIACYKCEADAILPLFNETSHICCENKIYIKKYGENTGCCRQVLMNTSIERCHDGTIIDFVQDTSSVTDVTVIIEVTDEEDGFDDGFKKEVVKLKAPSTGIIIIIIAGGSLAAVVASVIYFRCRCKNRRKGNNACTIGAEYLPPGENEQLLNDQVSTSALNCASINPIDVNSTPSEISTLISDDIYTPRFDTFKNDIVSKIKKSNNIPNENIFANHTKDSYTQTCPGKESNRRTIFGRPFDHNFILGMSNGTAVMPDSEVQMTLPTSLLKQNQVEVNCQSFRTINQLRKKLGLAADENIASPVVEYALTGYGTLQDYAVVIMPFLGPPSDLKVRKFQSDEGLKTVVESADVPLQGKTNEDVDAFYIVKDSVVYIYTKSFSGFYCTTCRHRPLRLRCFLFGSYKRFTNPIRYEVRLMMYLADELLKFADYRERMFTNENTEGRVLKKEMQLRLPQELCETDVIKASVVPTESHDSKWIHKLYPGGTSPIYDEVQTVEIETVAEKCKNCESCHLPEHDIPTCVEWYLTNADGVIPDYTFQCIVDVDIIHQADSTKTSNRIVIDELQLRQEDRCPVEEQFSARNLQGLKEYMSGVMSVEKRDAMLRALLSKYRCTGSTVEEVFFRLQDKLKPNYILEAVAIVMKEKHMFTELDVLQANGILPMNFISSVQSVYQDSLQGNGHIDEVDQESYVSGHIIGVNSGHHENSPDEVNQNQYENGHSDEKNQSPHGNGHSDEINCANGQPTDLVNETTNGDESQELPRAEEGKNTQKTFRLNKEYHEDESQKIVQIRPSNTLMNKTMVRPELSLTQRMMGTSKSLDDVTLTGASGELDVRGEFSKPAFEEKPSDESQTLHAQECASMDDTPVKTLYKRSKSEDGE